MTSAPMLSCAIKQNIQHKLGLGGAREEAVHEESHRAVSICCGSLSMTIKFYKLLLIFPSCQGVAVRLSAAIYPLKE